MLFVCVSFKIYALWEYVFVSFIVGFCLYCFNVFIFALCTCPTLMIILSSMQLIEFICVVSLFYGDS